MEEESDIINTEQEASPGSQNEGEQLLSKRVQLLLCVSGSD